MFFRWLWALGPGNPVAVRIVRTGSRRSGHFWARTGYLGALILLLWFGLLGAGGIAGEQSFSDLAKAGTYLFTVAIHGQVLAICLLAPLFMAGAISREHAGETFDILLTSPLSNLQVVLGSLFGRLFFVLALLAAGLPLFAVLLVFGGVEVASIFAGFAVAAVLAVSLGAIAVTLAVLRIGGRKAVFVFVIAVGAYLVGIYGADQLLRRIGTPGLATTPLTPLHPMLVLESWLSADYRPPEPETLAGYPAPVRWYLGRPMAAFVTLNLLLAAVLVAWSTLRLRAVGEGGEHPVAARLRRALRWGRRRRRAPRPVGKNPIYWREAHTRGNQTVPILARGAFVLTGLLAVGGLLGAYHTGNLPTVIGPGGGAMPPGRLFKQGLTVLLLVEVAVVTLVALYMSASCVSREREDGTLDLILTTPVTPRTYVWGKLRGLVGFLAVLISVPVLSLGVVAVYTAIGLARGWPQAMMSYPVPSGGSGMAQARFPLLLPEAPLLLLFQLVPFVSLCVAVGMNGSLKARGVLGAVVPAVGAIAAVVLLFGFCGRALVEELAMVGPAIAALSPTIGVVMILDPWEVVAGFAESAGAETFGRTSLALAALFALFAYGGVVYVMILGMVRNFDHTMRKLSGG